MVEGLYQAGIILYSTLCGAKRLALAPFNEIKLLPSWFQKTICPIFKTRKSVLSQAYLKRLVKLIKILWCKWHYRAASNNVFGLYPIERFWSADFYRWFVRFSLYLYTWAMCMPWCVLYVGVCIWICAYICKYFCVRVLHVHIGLVMCSYGSDRLVYKKSLSKCLKEANSLIQSVLPLSRPQGSQLMVLQNLKSWKNKLKEVLTTWERSLFLEAFLYCMIVKAPLFWALLLLCELKCWILVCAPPMRGKALRKLEEGYIKFSGNVFWALSQLFNKRQEYGSRCSAEACLEVSG